MRLAACWPEFDEVHKIDRVGRNTAVIPSFENARLEIRRRGSQHLAAPSPVLGGQVAKGQLVVQVLGIHSLHPFPRPFHVRPAIVWRTKRTAHARRPGHVRPLQVGAA